MKIEFKVGDIVTAFGLEGVVDSITPANNFPIEVDFKMEGYESFLLNGKLHDWHKEPSLKLVRRAEEFEEVLGYQAVYQANGYNSWIPDTIFKIKELALESEYAIGYREVKYMRRKV